jgi:very-short-patch-repair endonuclease
MRNSPAVPDPAPLAERLELVRKMIGQLAAQFEPARATDLIEELGGRFSDAQEQVTLLVDHVDQIEVWQAYMARSSALRADGWSAALDFCVDRKVPAGELAEVLERAMYAAWYGAVSMGDPTLRDIRADELEAKVAQFRDLDRQLVRDAAEHVVRACVARKPTTTVGPARIIDHQAQLKSRHMPVRRLLEQTAEVVTALKPCFMMSPLSVSQFLPPGFAFDTVIFDEASQITPADAANCIYRGRQLIVAGDDRQLPPTSFFQSGGSDTDSDEYEEGQFDEFESVLKLAKGTARLPSLPLRWHYRSKHESLITFSNYRFYEGNLITFPGAVERGADLGVEHFVVDGIYQRGGARINLPEARKAAERVTFHATRYPNNSLGVVAFSQPQADAIEDAVERLCEDYPDLEERLTGGRLDGFFVKNLESVQGDERDTMIFSVGYGPDEVGKLTAGFGPLNGESGWRRLNVAITRARRRVEVISSFRAPQLAALGSTNVGVLALQRYLDFAERGVIALAIDLSDSGGDVESPLEASVLSVLRSWGLDVIPQVGTAGYRIDLGVRDPRRPGRYLLGVECDGAAYHSSKLARDRDRLRQEVLEGLGWKLHRIWGSSWYRDRPGQERRLRMALEQALVDDGSVPVTRPSEPVVRTTIAADLDQAPDWAEPYRTFWASINSFRNPAEPLERSRLSAVVASVVRTESPIHMELLGRRIGQLWDCNATKRVRSAIQDVLWDLQRDGRCRITGDFIWTGAVPEKVPVRVPDPSDDRTRREIEHIAPEELQSAVRQLLIDARVAGEEELLVSVARLFGYERTGARIRSALDNCLRALMDDGMVVLGSDQLLRPR